MVANCVLRLHLKLTFWAINCRFYGLMERKDKKWFKRDIIVLISFLIPFVSISFLLNIRKEMSLPGFRRYVLIHNFCVMLHGLR